MFGWVLALFITALIAAVFGFTGVAAGAATAAKITFFVALILGVLALVTGRRYP